MDHALEKLPPVSADTCRMVWVRHGETDWNQAKRFQGHTDIPLNATGAAQALRLGSRLGRMQGQFQAVISSDLGRAMGTALPCAEALGLELHTTPTLRERDYGLFTGMTSNEMRAHHPEQFDGLTQRIPDAPLSNGESLRMFYERVIAAAQQIVGEHGGQQVLVVAHGGVLDCLRRLALGIELQKTRDWTLLNTSINVLDCDASGRWTVHCWGDVDHLDVGGAGAVKDEVDGAVA